MTQTSEGESDSDGFSGSARSEPYRRNRVNDPFESAVGGLQRMWLKLKQFYNYVMVDMGGYIALDKSIQWCRQNPNKSLLILGVAFIFMLPLLIGVAFGLSTIAMMFTGFLVLEGTILSILCMVLFVCLGSLFAVLTVFILLVSFVYFGFSHISNDAFGTSENFRTTMINFLQGAESRNRRVSESNRANRNEEEIAGNVS